jgi:hypothetical protein
MIRHLLLLFVCFAGFATGANAADPVSLKIRHFGIEGAYFEQQNPVWLQIEAQNNTSNPQSFLLRAYQADLFADSNPASLSFVSAMTLAPSEKRTIDIPLHLARLRSSVLYAEAVRNDGMPLGHAARSFGDPAQGKLIALLCGTESVCKSIRQAILLSGTPEEQTRKAQALRVIELTELPPVWWAYQRVDTIAIAAPIDSISRAQLDALEVFALRGGRLVLSEKEMGNASGKSELLGGYQTGPPLGKVEPVGGGWLVRTASVSGPDFQGYFRTYGFATSTPPSVEEEFARFRVPFGSYGQSSVLSWLHFRVAKNFRFPTFWGLFYWLLGYILLGLLVNFILLRRMEKPEWGWVTIPVLAILFSAVLYFVSARDRPKEYRLDEVRIYGMDSKSTMAISTSQVRISSPRKGTVRLALPPQFVYSAPTAFERYSDEYEQGSWPSETREIEMDKSWEAAAFLRVWSYQDFSFNFVRRFPGTVARTSPDKLTNLSGVDFDQAIFVTKDSVYLLNSFPAGASVDLSSAKKIRYKDLAGYTAGETAVLASPPFAMGPASDSREEHIFPHGSWRPAENEILSLQEIVRGWPIDGERVFAQTEAIFFGFGKDVEPAAVLRGTPANGQSRALYSVTYRDSK